MYSEFRTENQYKCSLGRLKTEISDLRAVEEELEERDRVTDKLDKQLKDVTSMVEQQTRNLREDLSRNIEAIRQTRRRNNATRLEGHATRPRSYTVNQSHGPLRWTTKKNTRDGLAGFLKNSRTWCPTPGLTWTRKRPTYWRRSFPNFRTSSQQRVATMGARIKSTIGLTPTNPVPALCPHADFS
jgi:small-conductance mechanosensitive channel